MADNNSSTQSNQNSGQGGGVFRDVNASIGGLEMPIAFGTSQSSAQSGDISVSGDVVSGGSHFGIGKILVLGLISMGLLWVWRKK